MDNLSKIIKLTLPNDAGSYQTFVYSIQFLIELKYYFLGQIGSNRYIICTDNAEKNYLVYTFKLSKFILNHCVSFKMFFRIKIFDIYNVFKR